MASNLDRVIVAISDPTRRAIISRLARGPARISDVAAPFPCRSPDSVNMSGRLERAGLVRRTHHGRENTLEFRANPCAR